MKQFDRGSAVWEQSDVDYFESKNVDCIFEINGVERPMKSGDKNGWHYIIRSKDGYEIISANRMEYPKYPWGAIDFGGTPTKHPFAISSGSDSVDFESFFRNAGYVVETQIKAPVSVPVMVLTQNDIDLLDENHVQLSVDSVVCVVGTSIEWGNVLRLVLTKPDYQIDVDSDLKSSVNISYLNSSDSVGCLNFTLDEETDFKSGYCNLTKPTDYVSTTALNVLTSFKSVVGTNNIYAVTNYIVGAVNKRRFSVWGGSVGTVNEPKDYGQFILSLKEYPFKLPESNVFGNSPIYLGSLNTNVESKTVNDETIYLDLGEINVVGVTGTSLDYTNSKAILHLPFIDSTPIDLIYVIDQTLSIKYKINLYSGSIQCTVESSKTGTVVLSTGGRVGVDVPYISGEFAPENTSIGNSLINDELTAYVELISSIPSNPDDFFDVSVSDKGILKNYTGYVKVDAIDLKVRCLQVEKDMIKQLLSEGVIIK